MRYCRVYVYGLNKCRNRNDIRKIGKKTVVKEWMTTFPKKGEETTKINIFKSCKIY